MVEYDMTLTEEQLKKLNEGELISLSWEQGGRRLALEELRRRRQALLRGEEIGVDQRSHAESLERLMASVGRKRAMRWP